MYKYWCSACFCIAQAPCNHAVEHAKAAVSENPNSTRALRELAAVREKDAEEPVHNIFRKYHLTIPIEPKVLNLGKGELKRFPYIPFSRWVRYLMDVGLASKHLCGVPEGEMRALLLEFWSRYKAIHGEHQMFAMEGLDLGSCIPCYSHVDEGRAYKKQGILLLSVHGCLGRGTRAWRKRVGFGVRNQNLKRSGMGLNYVGSSWGTQFLFCCLHRQAYSKDPTPLDTVMSTFAADMASLATDGVPQQYVCLFLRYSQI